MALIEKFHVVAAEQPVKADQTIKEGQWVSLVAGTGGGQEVVVVSTNNPVPYGVAGDTQSTSASYMPGVKAGWQNRVSDYYDETKASAKMTVYHSGGEFATDMFAANVASALVMTYLYANDNAVLDTNINGNTWLGLGAGGTGIRPPVAILTQIDGSYPSGVPGIDINGDQALSGDSYVQAGVSNVYIEFKMII
jgi:hypothetical protein